MNIEERTRDGAVGTLEVGEKAGTLQPSWGQQHVLGVLPWPCWSGCRGALQMRRGKLHQQASGLGSASFLEADVVPFASLNCCDHFAPSPLSLQDPRPVPVCQPPLPAGTSTRARASGCRGHSRNRPREGLGTVKIQPESKCQPEGGLRVQCRCSRTTLGGTQAEHRLPLQHHLAGNKEEISCSLAV